MINFNIFKILFFPFLFLVLDHSAFSQNLKSDLQALNLSDNVNTIHQIVYKASIKNGKVIKGKKLINSEDKNERIVFNSNGYKISVTYFSRKDKAIAKYECTYDNSMNIVGAYYYNYYNGYDIVVYKNKFDYIYDQNKMIKEQMVDQYGNVRHKAFCKYDNKGNLCEKIWLKPDSTLITRFTRGYDDNRNLIDDVSYDSTGLEQMRIKYQFDVIGRLTEQEVIKKKNFSVRYKFFYDQNQNIIEVDWCKRNERIFKKWTFNYEFDKSGNWIRMIQFKNDKLVKVTEREIFYNIN